MKTKEQLKKIAREIVEEYYSFPEEEVDCVPKSLAKDIFLELTRVQEYAIKTAGEYNYQRANPQLKTVPEPMSDEELNIISDCHYEHQTDSYASNSFKDGYRAAEARMRAKDETK